MGHGSVTRNGGETGRVCSVPLALSPTGNAGTLRSKLQSSHLKAERVLVLQF